ncbi:MAG TPA: toxin co-regulated pilus biosynthesis Q family protein, partial [Rhizobacter sp.]|nr:toxin co-regulated pilus biosynthesis Q family protein [Rhizobacter sp.]
VNRWELSERDRTLKLVIERWAQNAGWRAFWELDVDYPIAATASINGSFEEAVSAVVGSMDHADVPLKAIFYRGNQVLRMVPRGME